MDHKAQWIWQQKKATDLSEYMLFRKKVIYSRRPVQVNITVTADSCFILYINGQHVYSLNVPEGPLTSSTVSKHFI